MKKRRLKTWRKNGRFWATVDWQTAYISNLALANSLMRNQRVMTHYKKKSKRIRQIPNQGVGLKGRLPVSPAGRSEDVSRISEFHQIQQELLHGPNGFECFSWQSWTTSIHNLFDIPGCLWNPDCGSEKRFAVEEQFISSRRHTSVAVNNKTFLLPIVIRT